MYFGELAKAFKILHLHSKDWSEDDIISVMDELTSESSFISKLLSKMMFSINLSTRRHHGRGHARSRLWIPLRKKRYTGKSSRARTAP